MEGSGLTPFALGFLLLSMGSVTLLAGYCYWRILRQPGSAGGAAAGASPVEERGGDPRQEGS